MAEKKSLALVTGANSGIGFEVVRQLLADGSFHVLLGARSEQKGLAAVAELQSLGLPGTVELLLLDVADESSVAAAAKLVEEKHGRLDVLVNNAGVAGFGAGPLAERMVECFRVAAVGAQLMGDHFAPLLRRSMAGGTRTARIINVTSGAGSVGNRMDPDGFGNEMPAVPYRVSKAALNMVFACQYRALAPEGFKVFLYGPGPTTSGLTPANAGPGMKPTSVGAAPIVEMVQGKRDAEAGTYREYGWDSPFPW